eukprot:gene2269-biopygen1876
MLEDVARGGALLVSHIRLNDAAPNERLSGTWGPLDEDNISGGQHSHYFFLPRIELTGVADGIDDLPEGLLAVGRNVPQPQREGAVLPFVCLAGGIRLLGGDGGGVLLVCGADHAAAEGQRHGEGP